MYKPLYKIEIKKDYIEKVLFTLMSFFVFIYNYQEENYGNTITNGLILLFIFFELFINLDKSHNKLNINFYTYFILLFDILCALSILYSSAFVDSLNKEKTLIILLVMLISLNYFLAYDYRTKFSIIILSICAIFAAVYLMSKSNWRTGRRIGLIIGDSNQVGAYMAYSLCVILLCMKKNICLPFFV